MSIDPFYEAMIMWSCGLVLISLCIYAYEELNYVGAIYIAIIISCAMCAIIALRLEEQDCSGYMYKGRDSAGLLLKKS